jgi:iron complex transport system substrate-binding protein
MRIASLQPSISLTLAHLDRLDTLCAITKYCVEAIPELAPRNLAVLADSWSFDKSTPGAPNNLDALLDSRPDLVIASVPYRIESLAAILKSGVPLLALAPQTLTDIYDDIRLIGCQCDALPAAESLVVSMQAGIADASSLSASLTRKTVYCEEWGKPLIRSQPWVGELVYAAGGRFLGTPGTHATPEAVAAENPDVLLFAWCGAGDRVPLARVIAQRGWHGLRAVRNRQVFCIPDDYLNTPAFSLMEGLACIAGALHPDTFPPHPRVVALSRTDHIAPPLT